MKKRSLIWIVGLLFGVSSNIHANTPWTGSYLCKSNGQEIEITNTHLYIGEAHFKMLPRSDGDFFIYKDDVALISPIKGAGRQTIQVLFWKGEELRYNARNNSKKYHPLANMVCGKTAE